MERPEAGGDDEFFVLMMNSLFFLSIGISLGIILSIHHFGILLLIWQIEILAAEVLTFQIDGHESMR